MDSLPHFLNIGTLATWLSVAGFGMVGILVSARPTALDLHPALPPTECLAEDFTLGVDSSPTAPETVTPEPASDWPSPTAMPNLTSLPPLPDIPVTAPATTSSSNITDTPRPSDRANASEPTHRRTPGQPTSAARNGSPGAGSGLSPAARLAAGNMPPPAYPAEARRSGQTGTLLVEFTVDTSGRVISAFAKNPSPWPLLNEEAVKTVRRWQFPPGAVMKLQRPIVFQLR